MSLYSVVKRQCSNVVCLITERGNYAPNAPAQSNIAGVMPDLIKARRLIRLYVYPPVTIIGNNVLFIL
jgi:hypothetical protein